MVIRSENRRIEGANKSFEPQPKGKSHDVRNVGDLSSSNLTADVINEPAAHIE